MFQNTTIIGPGLIGASLAMALSNTESNMRINLWSRNNEKLKNYFDKNIFSYNYNHISDSVKESELVIICTPVNKIIQTLTEIKPFLKKDTLVTDVGSVKSEICDNANKLLNDSSIEFIGSHPMAGSEKNGIENADKNLFLNATCLLTPLKDSKKLNALEALWGSIGMKTSVISPKKHDIITAQISHLPHIIATSLAKSLSNLEKNELKYSGNGLKDTIRISGGDSHLWEAIISQNSIEIIKAIKNFEKILKNLKNNIKNNNKEEIKKILEEGKIIKNLLNQ